MTMCVNYSVLAGSLVRLEPISLDHVQGLYNVGQAVEDWKYLPIPGFDALSHAQSWVEQSLDLVEQGQRFAFVLVSPQTQTIMGSSVYMNVQLADYSLEIGYTWLGKEYQRTGVNTQAKYLLLQNAFETMQANRVELKTDSRNVRSQTAIARVGAVKEGILRNHKIVQGGYVRDTVMYSITGEEWPRVRAGLEEKML